MKKEHYKFGKVSQRTLRQEMRKIKPMHKTPSDNPGLTPVKVSRKVRAWMVARRFGKGALSGAASAFVPTLIATRDFGSAVTASAIGAVVGGVGMGSEKLIKENRKAAGKPPFSVLVKEWMEAIRVTIQYFKD